MTVAAGERIGFVGLGDQGAPMAKAIAEAGFELHAWARRPQSFDAISDVRFARHDTLEGLAGAVGILALCLRDDNDIWDLLREHELAAALRAGSVLVNHGTGDPEENRRIGVFLERAGVAYLDAPVSGGRPAAVAGTLTTLVGGSDDAFVRCRPVFESFSRKVAHMGPLGSGQTTKLLNNALTMTNLKNAVDVFGLARRLGIAAPRLYDVLAVSSGSSAILHAVGQDLTPNAAAHVQGLMRKDIEHFADAMRAEGLDPDALRDRGLAGAAGVVDLAQWVRDSVPPASCSAPPSNDGFGLLATANFTEGVRNMQKTILITGACSGIGRSAARKFESEGWNVVATMPDLCAPHGLVESDRLIIAQLDVREEKQCAAAVATSTARFGQVDALLSNAGYGQYGAFEAISPEQIENQFAVNVFGAMNMLRAVLPGFRARGTGLVLVTSSAGVKAGLPTSELYISTKFALEGFFESTWYELRAVGVGVKLIEPGGVDTGFHEVADRQTAGGGGIEVYDDMYRKIAAHRDQIIASGELVSPEEVADTIFEAATDGTAQLRYVVGKDAEHLVATIQDKPEAEVLGMIARQYGLPDLAPDSVGV